MTTVTTKLTRAADPVTRRVKALNVWREAYNPLRGLSIARAVQMLDAARRGMVTDLQWTYQFVEEGDADLVALIERRTGALLEMDWAIAQVDEAKQGKDFDQTLADEQAAALREAYEAVDNLYEGIEHLALATFRGYAHAEKVRNADGDVTHLEVVDTWNMVRDGMRGRWKYNPGALTTSFDGLPAENLVDPADFLIREVRRPVDRIGLIKFIRANLAEKDWDGSLEIFGIPGGVVIMPENVPVDKTVEYAASAEEIAKGGTGALPHGADYKPNDGQRGSSPFLERLDYLTKKLVLAGTGGMLTMLAESGSGTLAGGAHADTFDSIARSEARKISEVFQRQVDAEVLGRLFPGQRPLAYFRISANEETDAGEFVQNVELLGRAGYQVSPEQVKAKSGYEVSLKPDQTVVKGAGADPAAAEAAPILNRAPLKPGEDPAKAARPEALSDEQWTEVLGVRAAWLAPLRPYLALIENLAGNESLTPSAFLAAVEAMANAMPELQLDAGALADSLEGYLGAATVAGLRDSLAAEKQTPTLATP